MWSLIYLWYNEELYNIRTWHEEILNIHTMSKTTINFEEGMDNHLKDMVRDLGEENVAWK